MASTRVTHLKLLRELFRDPDPAAAAQGVELLRTLDDPVMWSRYARSAEVSAAGIVTVALRGELLHIDPGHHATVCLWALRATGRLEGRLRLNLSRLETLTDVGFLRGLSGLSELDLSDCRALRDISGLSGLTALRTLDLGGAARLGSLEPLRGLTQLRELHLSGCDEASDLEVLSSLVGLRTLHLSRLRRLEGCAPLAGLTGLTSLSLHQSTALTSVRELASMRRLQVLFLGGCTALESLAGLEGLPLEVLTLVGCDGLPAAWRRTLRGRAAIAAAVVG